MKLLVLTLALTSTTIFANNIPLHKTNNNNKIAVQEIENVEKNYIYKENESKDGETIVKKVDKKAYCMGKRVQYDKRI